MSPEDAQVEVNEPAFQGFRQIIEDTYAGHRLYSAPAVGPEGQQVRNVWVRESEPDAKLSADYEKVMLGAAELFSKMIHLRDSALPFVTDYAVSDDRRLETLTGERDALFVQNESLKSRVEEERRRAEDALGQRDKAQADLDKFLDAHGEVIKTNKDLLSALIARVAGKLSMFESYYGIVEHVHGERAFVVFETDGDPIEHVYERDQFIGGRLPKEGTKVAVHVLLTAMLQETPEGGDETGRAPDKDESPRQRKNVITGPYSF